MHVKFFRLYYNPLRTRWFDDHAQDAVGGIASHLGKFKKHSFDFDVLWKTLRIDAVAKELRIED